MIAGRGPVQEPGRLSVKIRPRGSVYLMKTPIRVLIVDDSALMRQLLSDILAQEPQVQVVGTARNGAEALTKVGDLRPDVITLDVEMPVMDGLTTLAAIMERFPRPVIMVSALAQAGAQVSLRALELGAVDLVAKPGMGQRDAMAELRRELPEKVKGAAYARPQNQMPATIAQVRSVQTAPGGRGPTRPPQILAIASSTGGPAALNLIISGLPADFPLPVVVAQHMPMGFTRHLAQRLDALSALRVEEARDGQKPRTGLVMIAPSGWQFRGIQERGERRWRVEEAPEAVYRPSADVLFASAGEVWKEGVLALILTGMGNDGSKGLLVVKEKRGYVVAQSRETCVIYGMPRAAVEVGVVDEVVPLPEISRRLQELARGTGRQGA